MDKYEIRRINLLKLMKELCNNSIKELSNKLDKDPSYVSRLLYEEGKKNKKNIADRATTDIEQAFNLPRGWLDGLSVDNQAQPAHENIKKEDGVTGVKVDVLDIFASCGNGVVVNNEFENVLRSIEFTSEFALKLFGTRNTKNIKIITAKGDSMQPTIKSGANVFVDTQKNFFDGDGVYVFIFDNEIYIKRIQVTFNEVIVISDNSLYEKWRLPKSSIDQFYIQGKVFIGQNIEYIYFD